MVYAIEKTTQDSFMFHNVKTFLFEREELRDETFNGLLKKAKEDKCIEDIKNDNNSITYYDSKLRVEISKIELKLSTKENIDKDVFL